MYRVRVLATQREIGLITKAARQRGLTAQEFVTRVAKASAKKHTTSKTMPSRFTSPKHTRSARRKPRS